MRDLDDQRARLGVVEAEAEGLRATMLDMQSRHIEQINRCARVCVVRTCVACVCLLAWCKKRRWRPYLQALDLTCARLPSEN